MMSQKDTQGRDIKTITTIMIIIIITEICKAHTLRLKALNKHNITQIMYIEIENVISNKNVRKTTTTKQQQPNT